MLRPSVKLSCRLITCCMFLIALVPLSLGGWSYFHTKDFINRAASTSGIVTDLIEQNGHEGGSTYAPRVKFSDTNGTIIEATSSTSSYPPRYQVGDTIKILYDAEVPQKFRTTDWFSLWGSTIIGLAIGSFAVLMSVLVALLGPIIFKGLINKQVNKEI